MVRIRVVSSKQALTPVGVFHPSFGYFSIFRRLFVSLLFLLISSTIDLIEQFSLVVGCLFVCLLQFIFSKETVVTSGNLSGTNTRTRSLSMLPATVTTLDLSLCPSYGIRTRSYDRQCVHLSSWLLTPNQLRRSYFIIGAKGLKKVVQMSIQTSM